MVDLLSLADERFVSLTTFRKTGVAVSTPVWIARDGDALIVTTPDDSGKVKRLRNDPRIELRPCSRMGAVADDAPVATGTAEISGGADAESRLERIFKAKYRFEYSLIMFIEGRGKAGKKPRAMLRITAA
ncbi:MAG: hypothetical protein RI885_2381 [Actinomycetota bacterium]|jgi:PPOX class probable F420-dependent enzyme